MQAERGALADRRVVRDNVDWDYIATQMGTRNHQQCMERWYERQVAPPLD